MATHRKAVFDLVTAVKNFEQRAARQAVELAPRAGRRIQLDAFIPGPALRTGAMPESG